MFSHLFNEGPYRFQMRFEKGTVADFYGATAEHQLLLEERQRWLSTELQKCVVARPEGVPLIEEFAQERGIRFNSGEQSPEGLCAHLGKQLEPDFLLLNQPDLRLVAGCVCFPSSWDVREKIGLPVSEIHRVVPGLNAGIGGQIERFLGRLRPGVSWERSNWGLSRSAELNQHPSRALPRLDENVSLEQVFFRIEHQSLAALPRSGGVLFGIRIRVQALRELKTDAEMREKLATALETMPEEMALYKNIARARGRILELLREG